MGNLKSLFVCVQRNLQIKKMVPRMGRERVMSPSSKPLATADTESAKVQVSATSVQGTDLLTIVEAIAHSPIVFSERPLAPALELSEWERLRHTADADDFILAWIASHVRQRRPAALV
jgi:hypothetical protein